MLPIALKKQKNKNKNKWQALWDLFPNNKLHEIQSKIEYEQKHFNKAKMILF